MEGFTLVDAIVAAVILISAVLAYSRGLVREVLAIAGWVASAYVAYAFAANAEPLVREVPVISDFLENCTASTIAAFAGVFALALIVFSLFAPAIASLVQRSALNGIDQGLGFLYGAARGILLVVVALLIYDFVAGNEGFEIVENSRSAAIFESATERLSEEFDNQEVALAWLTERFESLIETSCGSGATDA